MGLKYYYERYDDEFWGIEYVYDGSNPSGTERWRKTCEWKVTDFEETLSAKTYIEQRREKLAILSSA